MTDDAPAGARRWLAKLLLRGVQTAPELVRTHTSVPLNVVHALALVLGNAELSADEHAELFQRFKLPSIKPPADGGPPPPEGEGGPERRG